MRKIFGIASAMALVFALSGCAAATNSNPANSASSSSSANQTPDASLIPPAPDTNVKAVDASLYDTGYSEYLFRAGNGPAWCTINADQKWVLCEQNEATAQYKPVAVPSTCDGSYGYQIKLWESTPADGTDTAGFVCASGLYNDGSVAPALNAGEKVTVGGITCYVADTTVRCDNQNGQYIALGAQVWAAKN